MLEIHKIKSFSETQFSNDRKGNVVVMVGSFAPIHDGYIDAAYSACSAIANRGYPVESLVFTPNSSEYLAKKLPEDSASWPYERRVKLIQERGKHPWVPTYVDDISGPIAKGNQINDIVPSTVLHRLGFCPFQQYLVVGSDQLLSMESHLSERGGKAICVLRPGSMEAILRQLDITWVSDAIASERLVITERKNMREDVSSSAIRKHVVQTVSVV